MQAGLLLLLARVAARATRRLPALPLMLLEHPPSYWSCRREIEFLVVQLNLSDVHLASIAAAACC